MTAQDLIYGAIVVAIFLLIAFPVHEFSHAWVAYRLGDSTARYQGRLTLNPLVHFDPLGGTLLAISVMIGGIGFGWAKPTPVNPYNLRYGRRGEALVALAGPISNLVMALVVAIPLRLLFANGSFGVLSSEIAGVILTVAITFVVIDIALLVFNLLPIPPLDGWRALLGLVDARTAMNLRQFEQYGFVVLILIIVAAPRFLGGIVRAIASIVLGFQV
ncbi:MAG TPA: site-2 protease family protein [Candidatus Limnocylindria bacterium]|nr:site-2 protease family protein [Candidatus Limnocylindria bacterium]